MFWISSGLTSRIERAALSGRNKQTLVSSFLFQSNGITIDFSANRLYWVNRGFFTKRIESIDFNGNNRQRLMKVYRSSPYDIVLYSGVFYFSDSRSHSIGKIDKKTKQSLGSYTGIGSSNVLGLAMFSPLRQPKGKEKNYIPLSNRLRNCSAS